jgi:hypothetical protein
MLLPKASAWWNEVSTSLERFQKILSRNLGAIPYRPGAGGTQNVEKPRRAIGNYKISYLLESNEKSLSFAYNVT